MKLAESSDIEKFAANIAIRANQYQGTVYWQIDSRFQPTLKKKIKLLCPLLNSSSLQTKDSKHKCVLKNRLT